MFDTHFMERYSEDQLRAFSRVNFSDRKARLSGILREHKLSIDGTLLPVSAVPRILPREYKKTVEDSCRLVTRLYLDSLYDPNFMGSLDSSNLIKFLIDARAYESLPEVLVGSARFDFAVVGDPLPDNPPKFLEANLLNYAGIGWLPAQKAAVIEVVPEISDVVDYNTVFDDLSSSLAENFSRMGHRFLMVCDGDWEDFQLFRSNMRKFSLIFDYVDLRDFREGKVILDSNGARYNGTKYDALYLKCLSDEEEILEDKDVVARIIDSRVPLYETPAILPLEDKGVIGRLAGSRLLDRSEFFLAEKVFPRNNILTQELMDYLRRDPHNYVLKNRSAHEGKAVFVGDSMLEVITNGNTIRNLGEWCVQQRYKLNTHEIESTEGARGKAIVDLACYVSFVYNSKLPERDRFIKFELSAPMSRFSSTSYIVNIKQGGGFVPVFIGKN